MVKRRLSESQLAAIEYLSLPKRGGLTYEEVAEKVGIARSTLQEWRKDDVFITALNKRIVQNTQEFLPEIFEAAVKGITEDRNAAIFRTFLQAHGLLTDKVELETSKSGADTNEMKAQIEAFRRKNATDSE